VGVLSALIAPSLLLFIFWWLCWIDRFGGISLGADRAFAPAVYILVVVLD
jgi:hypothetical protein